MEHHFPLHKFSSHGTAEIGQRIEATKSNFSALQGMSFYKLIMQPRTVREPHWHANADELGYCLKGSLLVSFYGNGNLRQAFVVSEGDASAIARERAIAGRLFRNSKKDC